MRLTAGCIALLGMAASGFSAPVVASTLERHGAVVSFAGWGPIANLNEQEWLAATRTKLWVLDPPGGRVVRLAWANGAQEARGEWRVPQQMVAATRGASVFRIAAAGDHSLWVVDSVAQRAWLFSLGEWNGPWPIGEAIGGVAGLADGRLLLNTPQNAAHAFAFLRSDGRIEGRFGSRLVAPSTTVAKEYNTWRLTQTADGRLVGAQAYGALVRIYGIDGKLIQESIPAVEHIERLEKSRRAREKRVVRDSTQCCVTTELVHFAANVLPYLDGVLLRVDGASRLYFLRDINLAGEFLVAHKSDTAWQTGGLALLGNVLLAAESDGVVEYRAGTPDGHVERRRVASFGRTGLVVDEAGAPVAGAAIVLRVDSYVTNLETDDQGRFSLASVESRPRDSEAAIEVTAAGYRTYSAVGTLQKVATTTVVLSPGEEQCVEVRDAESRAAVTSYELSLISYDAGASHSSRKQGPTVAVSNPEGQGCLRGPWLPPWIVRVKAPGYATTEVPLVDTAELQIDLAPEALLAVVVSEQSLARPIQNAQIALEPADSERRGARVLPDEAVAVSDEDGRAQIQGVKAGRYRLTVERQGFLRSGREIDIKSGPNQVGVELSPGSQVTAVVFDRKDGNALAGATIQLEPRGAYVGSNLVCTTAADGRCRIAAVPPGTFMAVAASAGRAVAKKLLQVPAGEESVEITLEVATGIRVYGRVSGTEQYPGVSFDLLISSPGSPLAYGPIASDGSFAINDVAAGPVSVWVVEQSKTAAVLFEQVNLPEWSSEYEITLQLPAPLIVEGRLRHGARPCGACSLVFKSLSAEYGAPELPGQVSPDGRYLVRLPGSGSFLAIVRDPDSGRQLREIVVVRGPTERDFDLGLAVMQGRVVTESGFPVENAVVQCMSDHSPFPLADTVTDSAGRFRLELPPDVDRIVAWHRGVAAAARVDPAIGAPDQIELVLRDGPSVRLRLVDAVSGATLTVASANVSSPAGERLRHARLFAEKDGTFVVPAFEVQPLAVVIKAPGYATKTLRNVMATDAPITVPLALGGRTLVVDVNENCAPPCSFALADAAGPVALSAEHFAGPVPFTARRGYFYDIAPGQYEATLATCSGMTESQKVTIGAVSPPVLLFGSGLR